MMFMRSMMAVLALALFAVAVPLEATAQEAAQQNGFRIAVIDVDMIRRQSLAVKDIQVQISKYRTAFQAEIQKEEDALRKAQQEVARQRASLSEEAFAEERHKFEQNVANVQRALQQRKQTLDRMQGEAMRVVERKVNEIVAAMVKENGLSLLLKRRDAVFVTPQLEISQVVLDRLNKELKTVKVGEPGK